MAVVETIHMEHQEGRDAFYRVSEVTDANGRKTLVTTSGVPGRRGRVRCKDIAQSMIGTTRVRKWNEGYSTTVTAVHHVDDRQGDGPPSKVWLHKLQRSFERAAADMFEPDRDDGGNRCVIALLNVGRWMRTPGFFTGTRTVFIPGRYGVANDVLVATIGENQGSGLTRGWLHDDLVFMDFFGGGNGVDPETVDLDTLDHSVVAGLFATSDGLDAPALADAVENAALLERHTT